MSGELTADLILDDPGRTPGPAVIHPHPLWQSPELEQPPQSCLRLRYWHLVPVPEGGNGTAPTVAPEASSTTYIWQQPCPSPSPKHSLASICQTSWGFRPRAALVLGRRPRKGWRPAAWIQRFNVRSLGMACSGLSSSSRKRINPAPPAGMLSLQGKCCLIGLLVETRTRTPTASIVVVQALLAMLTIASPEATDYPVG